MKLAERNNLKLEEDIRGLMEKDQMHQEEEEEMQQVKLGLEIDIKKLQEKLAASETEKLDLSCQLTEFR